MPSKLAPLKLLNSASMFAAAALACGAALSVTASSPTMAAGAYHAPPAPVFRAPPAPVYVAPRVVTTPGATIRPTTTVRPGSVAKPAVRPGTARQAAARKQFVAPVIITTTTTAVAKCTPKQIEVLERCKKR
jgi:hypothetical protein